ncbi:unnamed protein product [Arabidopsis halleri]
MSENLRITAEHNRIVRPRKKIQHEQNREENQLNRYMSKEGGNFEVLQQQERAKRLLSSLYDY